MKLLVFLLISFIFSNAISAQKTKLADKQHTPNIIWDSSSRTKVSMDNRNANYARMIQIDNKLICVYESAGSIQCTQSMDEGKTWQMPVTVAAKKEGINMSVPDILELQDGSLLVSYNPRPYKRNGSADTANRFAICTIKSYDGGITWRDQRTLYKAGFAFEDGCWEPSQIQLPSGEIQLFFSDEGIYTQSNEQNISMFRSFDNGISWSPKPAIVSFTPLHRDGMPVPLLLHNKKEIVFSIEENAGGQFKPSVIRNSFTQNWQKTVGANDQQRTSALLTPLPDTVYAGAPFIRQLHSGETVLSYQSNENRAHNWERSCMQVAVGNSEAKHFVPVAAPFQIPLQKQGLWNSLCILKDDTIVAVTSTNAFTETTSVWMIKGKLVYK